MVVSRFLRSRPMIGLFPAVALALAIGAAREARADLAYYGLDTVSSSFTPVADANGAYVEITASATYSATTFKTTVDLIVSAAEPGATVNEFGFNVKAGVTANDIALYQGSSNTGSSINFNLSSGGNVDDAGSFSYSLGGPFNSNAFNPVLVEFTVSGELSLAAILTANAAPDSNMFVAHLKSVAGGTGYVKGGTPEFNNQILTVPEPASIVSIGLGGAFALAYGVRRRSRKAN
jgi:hypothetical protein